MDGDVVPCWDGELLRVEGRRYVAVRAGKDDESFAAGEGLPMRVGFGEVAFEQAVLAFVADYERKMRGDVRR